ncbi:MAG: Asp-tRNA(Asn)/Glu-tRNA(Gln) amidotransferase subunit GatC [Bacilli bacterium]|nr:Asp-tRNA(Asn)/Glu-tRNA(Gln) amidotransferase subunit GatC [Bacilli bacterium]
MEEKLDLSVIEHVAALARIELTEEEKEKYAVDLKKLWDEVEKISEIKNYDEELLITPVEHNIELREDINNKMISFEEVKKNAPRTSGNFVEVPVMIHE